jgi:hypothetical protein
VPSPSASMIKIENNPENIERDPDYPEPAAE